MAANDPVLRLTDGDVAELIDPAAAHEAVERGLLAEAAGDAQTLPKSVLPFSGGLNSLHMLGAVSSSLGLACVKSWLHAGPVAFPVLTLFDCMTGRCVATIEATVLSNLRTAALAGVATDRLAARDADNLALIGSGKLASAMLAAIAAVRPLKSVAIWSPTAKNREALADAAVRTHRVSATAAASAADALGHATIVGMAARMSRPVYDAGMVMRGAHVNAIGITVSGRSEIPRDLFARCAVVCTDSLPAVRALSDDFAGYFGKRGIWEQVRALSQLAPGGERAANWDLTLYKGMGTGIADLALGAETLIRASARGDIVNLPDALAGIVDAGGG